MSQEIFYVTGNESKFKEINDFICWNNVPITLRQYHVELTEEQILDQKLIAVTKAMQAWQILKKPLIVDDAGFFFEKYPKFPGTLSKPVVQALGWDGVLEFALSIDNHRMFHAIHLVYMYADDSYEVFYSECHGTVIKPDVSAGPKGLEGFGFFVPDGSKKTYAQMYGTTEFEKFSYRMAAFKKFLEWHKKNG
ncbi:MAG: non-canonical purine NTP pyrophosphatase [bacterium]